MYNNTPSQRYPNNNVPIIYNTIQRSSPASVSSGRNTPISTSRNIPITSPPWPQTVQTTPTPLRNPDTIRPQQAFEGPAAELEAGTRYQQGWGKGEGDCPATSGSCGSNTQFVHFKGRNYNEVKSQCLKAKTLFEDPDFPANNSSLFPREPPPELPRNVTWKRPMEIINNPRMFVGGASRFDVKQGVIGDCWLLSSVASLCQNERFLFQVAPLDQDFDRDYCGAFRFYFWRYGRWTEVVIDDRLPVDGQFNNLLFLHSQTPNEFWAPLVEKAYAKLFGCYEALQAGNQSEAMEDFTGGICERIIFREKETLPKEVHLHTWMKMAIDRGSLLGCGIDAVPGQKEAKLPNGLVCGHAYSVTGVTTIEFTEKGRQQKLNMVRLRNPWGNEDEWLGDWSDRSPKWKLLSDAQKDTMGFTTSGDGEFWMSYDNFISEYNTLEICHVPQSAEERKNSSKWWECVTFEGSWKINVNAGGCINFLKTTFPTNPQYQFDIVSDNGGKSMVLVGVMQKAMRENKLSGGRAVKIGYIIYKMDEATSGPLDTYFFNSHNPACDAPKFRPSREVCGCHFLTAGRYCVIPSTFEQNMEAEFLLRIFSEQPMDTREIDEETNIRPGAILSEKKKLLKANNNTENPIQKHFDIVVGEAGEMNALLLRDVLNYAFKKDLQFDGFTLDTCKSLLAMMDIDKSGSLNCDEFEQLWLNIKEWKNVFQQFDVDKSGNFNTYEMREAIRSVGYSVSNATFNALVQRYSHIDGKVYFDNFVQCLARLQTMFEVFTEMKKQGDAAVFTVDQFIQTTMYS